MPRIPIRTCLLILIVIDVSRRVQTQFKYPYLISVPQKNIKRQSMVQTKIYLDLKIYRKITIKLG